MKINICELVAINKHFSSVEQTRYYLNGVFVEARGHEAFLVATNGHVMIAQRVELDEPETFSCIVPSGFLRGYKIKRSNPVYGVLSFDGGTIRIDWNGERRECKEVDGTFPNWRRVVPDECYDIVPGVYRGDDVKNIDDAAKVFDSRAIITPAGDNKPALFHFAKREDVIGVVSGMTKFSFNTSAPSWSRK